MATSVGLPLITRSSSSCSTVTSVHSAAIFNISIALFVIESSIFVTSSSLLHTRRTRISFCVSVPVLSEQITLAVPRVSTAGSCRIIACFLAIFCTPYASVNVTITVKVSGTAATAKEIEVMNISRSGSPCNSPITNTKAAAAKAIILIRLPS